MRSYLKQKQKRNRKKKNGWNTQHAVFKYNCKRCVNISRYKRCSIEAQEWDQEKQKTASKGHTSSKHIKTGEHLDGNLISLFAQWPLRGCKQEDEFNLVFGEKRQQPRIKSQQNWWENQGYSWKKSVTWKIQQEN